VGLWTVIDITMNELHQQVAPVAGTQSVKIRDDITAALTEERFFSELESYRSESLKWNSKAVQDDGPTGASATQAGAWKKPDSNESYSQSVLHALGQSYLRANEK
jgi:hypothetical protein